MIFRVIKRVLRVSSPESKWEIGPCQTFLPSCKEILQILKEGMDIRDHPVLTPTRFIEPTGTSLKLRDTGQLI